MIQEVLHARMQEERQVTLLMAAGREVTGCIAALDSDALLLAVPPLDAVVIRLDAITAISWNDDVALWSEPPLHLVEDSDPPHPADQQSPSEGLDGTQALPNRPPATLRARQRGSQPLREPAIPPPAEPGDLEAIG